MTITVFQEQKRQYVVEQITTSFTGLYSIYEDSKVANIQTLRKLIDLFGS